MNRKYFINKLQETVDDRGNDYGSPAENLQNIANFWSEYKGTQFNIQDVGIMMMLLKIARLKQDIGPQRQRYSFDSWLDIAGYALVTTEAISDTEDSLHPLEDRQNIAPMKQG
jgi:hypothetical protein